MEQLQDTSLKMPIFLDNLGNGLLNLMILYKNKIRLPNYTFLQVLDDYNPYRLLIINVYIVFYLGKHVLTDQNADLIAFSHVIYA